MKCPLSKFKDIFGKPGEGAHSIRFLGTAVVDYVLTIVLAIITTLATKMPLVLTTIIWFLLGTILHLLFGVQTSTLTYLGINCK
tara:strand:+ start:43 stop:294 length:252 start_codon:yes stop_codon:yes gene_type:complete